MNILYPPRFLPAPESFDYWNEVVNSTYGHTINRALCDTPFDGRLRATRLGTLLLTHITSKPIEYQRKHDGEDDQFSLCLTLSTEAELEQQGRASTQGRGDMVLFSNAEPYLCRFPKGDDQLVLSIPRERLIQHLPTPEAFTSRTLGGQSTLGKLAANMMVEVLEAGYQPPHAAERLSGALLEVLATAFEREFELADSGHSSRHAAQLLKAKQFLLAHLHDSSLDMATIAQAIHVSPRALSRLFALEGSTAIRWLWQQRLHACRTALLKSTERSVSEVALSHGFTNMAHFSRAFKTAFGVSPSVFVNPG